METRTKRIRPSSLWIASKCRLAPRLAVAFPESRAETRFGSAVDKQASTVLSCIAIGDTDNLPSDEDLLPETAVILDWIKKNYPLEQWEWHVQEKVDLLDPETGDELTSGTPDLICLHRSEPRFVDVDLKKMGQIWAGHLQKPDENEQQLAYVAAAWLKYSRVRTIEMAKIVLAGWDERTVRPLESSDINEERLWKIIDMVRSVPPMDLDSPMPEASVGDHCLHCYQRMRCHAHLLPLAVVTQAGLPAPFAEFVGGELTAETTVKALAWLEGADRVLREAKKIRDLVEGNADAYVTQHGPVTVGELCYGPQDVKGNRAGATIKTLEKEGLQRLIREGDTKVKCKWYPAKA